MSLSLTVAQGGYGFDVEEDIRICIARGGAITAQQLCCVCLATDNDKITGDSLTPSILPGGVDSVYTAVTAAYSDASRSKGIFCVALDDVPDQGTGRFQFKGFVERAKAIRSDNGAMPIGQGLVPAIGSSTGMLQGQYTGVTPASTANRVTQKLIAISRTAGSATATAATYKILLDGVQGFGSVNQ